MNINRAIQQQLQVLELAGLQQLNRSSQERAEAMLQRLQALGDEASDAAVEAPTTDVHSTEQPPSDAAVASPQPIPAASQEAKSPDLRLKVLSEQVAACQQCPQLVANRTNTVFGVGNPTARFCFFGEGPGADEDRQGEPFVGAAGQLLDKIIAACKMQRSDVYILNTVKCRPPGNRNPEPNEISNCRSFFEQQLEIIRPEFIVCLGKVAANTLLENDSPVGRLRGRLHTWRDAQVLVTYHPAYLLRSPEAKKPVWEDMKMLMRAAGVEL